MPHLLKKQIFLIHLNIIPYSNLIVYNTLVFMVPREQINVSEEKRSTKIASQKYSWLVNILSFFLHLAIPRHMYSLMLNYTSAVFISQRHAVMGGIPDFSQSSSIRYKELFITKSKGVPQPDELGNAEA
jgi:hypothetical protein